MRSRIPVFTVVMFLVTLAGGLIRGQGKGGLFDAARVGKEIEVMKSIISTSLSMMEGGGRSSAAEDELIAWEMGLGERSVDGIYLYGQGVVFTIELPRVPSDRLVRLKDVEKRLAKLDLTEPGNAESLQARMYFLQSQMEMLQHSLAQAQVELEALDALDELRLGKAPPVPETPPLPEVAPGRSVGKMSDEDRAKLKEKVEKMKQKLASIREATEVQVAEREKYRSQIKEELIEILASHGDSLSQLGEEEYINLILTPQRGLLGGIGRRGRTGESQPDILSVKKSDIVALKMGRMSREEFRSRVLEY